MVEKVKNSELLPRAAILAAGLLLMAFIGVTDYLTGYELSFSIFYLIPVLLVTWNVGFGAGIFMALAGGVTWYFSDYYTHPVYSKFLIPYWNAFVRTCFFLITSYMLARLTEAMEREKNLARTDPLTGLSNSRAFLESADVEIERSRRHFHPMTLAYMDLDGFKSINDTLGHGTGDKALKLTASLIMSEIRKTDKAARMGGDEFAILLPETNAASAAPVLNRIRSSLIEAMKHSGWAITFSIGAATFETPPNSVEDMVRAADELMYEVKTGGKDGIRSKTI